LRLEEGEMPKRMKITFEKGGELEAEFLEDKAPVTSRIFWKALPIDATMIHCMSAGHETYTDDIRVSEPIPEENLVHAGKVGDVATVSGRQTTYLTQLEADGMTTLCFVYGPDQRFMGTNVQTNRATVFATIRDLKKLREIGHRMRIHGKEKVKMIPIEDKSEAAKWRK
jgi:hypothetical protein